MTGNHREIELKLELSPEGIRRLQRHPRVRELAVGRAITRPLLSVYYDSPDQDLAREGIGLRLRRVDGRQIQTVKTRGRETGGLFDRGEFESPVAGDAPDLDAISALELRSRVLDALKGKPLQPVFETRMKRTRRLMRDDRSEWTLDLDVGEVRAGDASEPICEVELELRQGDPASLYELALELERTVELRPGTRSKAARGYALLNGAPAEPKKATSVKLGADATLEEALEAIFQSCLDQICSNAEVACEGLDPEGVHQMRVGVRRARSAIGVFGAVLPAPRMAPLEQELRWLGAELGAVRALDVFAEDLLGAVSSHSEAAGLARLRDEVQLLRDQRQRALRSAIDSGRYTRLVLAMSRWLARAEWRDQPLSESGALLFQPARGHARKLVSRLHRRALGRGRGIEEASSASRHELRIRLKKLRHTADHFSSLFPRRAVSRYLGRLGKLLDALGQLNDVKSARRTLEELVDRGDPGEVTALERGVGFVEGWAARREAAEKRRLPRLWRGFEEAEPFWKGR